MEKIHMMLLGVQKGKALVLLLVIAVASCALVSSSLNYTKGTEALVAGDYEAAVDYLEEAVRLEPNLSRNRNNLASAYFGMGRYDESWIEVRKAVLLPPTNTRAWQNCQMIFMRMTEEKNIAIGDLESTVEAKLGVPDLKIVESDDRACNKCSWWQYGSVRLNFVDGSLSNVGYLVYRRR